LEEGGGAKKGGEVIQGGDKVKGMKKGVRTSGEIWQDPKK